MLRVFHVASQRGKLVAPFFEPEHTAALALEGRAQRSFALARHASAGERTLCRRAHRFLELLLELVQFVGRGHVLRMIGTDPLRQVTQLRLAIGKTAPQLLDEGAGDDLRRRIVASAAHEIADLALFRLAFIRL
jgi:hypothetical protein